MEDEKDKTQDQPKDDEKIKAIREEYDKKFLEMQNSHNAEIEKLKKDHIDEIRSLIAGSHMKVPEENQEPENEKSEYDTALEELRKKFKLI